MKFLANTSSPARLQRASGVIAIASPARSALWLVGADISVFARINLSHVPARHRPRAIAERVRQLAPFASPAWHAADQDGEVSLWFWDDRQVRAAMVAEGGATRRWEVLPEQVFFPPRGDDCLRTIGNQALIERWRAGRLEFSALLPEEARERALRMRAAGLPPDASPPPADSTLADKRWDLPAFDWRRAVRNPVSLPGMALLGTILWLFWSVAELAGVHAANGRVAAAVAARETELAPLLGLRERALALEARNRALADQLARVDALEVAAEFERLAGEHYQRLLQWEFNGRGVRATLEDSTPDNRAYVEAITSSRWFPRVSVTPGLRPEQISLDVAFEEAPVSTPVLASPQAGSSP